MVVRRARVAAASTPSHEILRSASTPTTFARHAGRKAGTLAHFAEAKDRRTDLRRSPRLQIKRCVHPIPPSRHSRRGSLHSRAAHARCA